MTVADLIQSALRTLGVIASGEAPTASEQADALVALNDMLDSWAGERLALWATLRSSYTLTSALSPQTIGTGGTFDTTRPVRIDRASIVQAASPNAEIPLDILSDEEWQALQGKGTYGFPTFLWIESAYPLMKLHLQPVPLVADSLILYTWQQIGRFADASATFDLPQGYARAVRYNLALELAPEYGVTLSPEAATIAEESKSTVKRLNQKPSYLRADPAILGRGGSGGTPLSVGSSANVDVEGGLF